MSDATIYDKTDSSAPSDFFAAEAAGLRWLADAQGAAVAEVVSVSRTGIRLRRIESTRPSMDAARAFGAALATTHAAGADSFGAPPAGWDGTLYIGRRPMPSAHDASWGRFYARDRVLPFLEIAEQAGTVTERESDDVRAACRRIAAGEFDDDRDPARIHGDLWNGNVLFSPSGVVLIDPAAHGGHPETDLAMLALFGCPYLEEIVAAYDEAAPLRGGWRDRIPLHQLHPLAVHAAGHGPSYGVALGAAARAVLAL